MKQNTTIILLLLIGTLGIAGVWKIRYQSGYDYGIVDGIKEGNHTGFIDGFDTGIETGFNAGYNDGFDLGKEIGNENGYSIGFDTGTQEGELDGYTDGYAEGESTGLSEGYLYGLEYGSKSSTLRDPTKEEALQFIETDDTDELFNSDHNFTYNYFLSRIRKNAANEGYRCIWVQVEMFGTDVYFCAFNTTDSDILYFNYRCDHIHEIEIGKQCYDERYIEPDFDDTITKIKYIY